ncbi:MAG: VWA domain-containing protein [Candidatus Uhrbacteria bacterium]|nr:VWA domain-containing protein [Patescibacteria group bacterium]MBU1907035.1 VWA domain-containing protein [Patescibacteria group bacterium]
MSIIHSLHLLDVKVTPGRAVALATGEVRIQYLIDVRPNIKNSKAPPTDIRFVIDVSGSMSEAADIDGSGLSKLEAIKNGVADFVSKLTPDDFAMLVVFSEGAEILFPHQRLGRHSKLKLEQILRGLATQGNTRFSEALEEAIGPSFGRGTVPRLAFLTDGQTNNNPMQDIERAKQFARESEHQNLPWLMYGTGVSYDEHLLNELAHLGAPGSAMAHVANVAALEAELGKQLSFVRGTAIERLTVEGITLGGKFVSVTRFMPVQNEVTLSGNAERFLDRSGSIDPYRGQQFFLELEMDQPLPGEHDVLTLIFRGWSLARKKGFEVPLTLRQEFTDLANRQSMPHPDVVRTQQAKIACEMARREEEEAQNRAADIFDHIGDTGTADTIRRAIKLRREHGAGHHTALDAARTVGTFTTRSVTECHTQVCDDEDVKPRRRWHDSDPSTH